MSRWRSRSMTEKISRNTMPGQMRLLISITSSSNAARLSDITQTSGRRNKVDHLKDEPGKAQASQVKDEARRERINCRTRKPAERSLSLATQIESIERNPYAILHGRSLLPDIDQARAWYNQPIDALRPDSLGSFKHRLF